MVRIGPAKRTGAVTPDLPSGPQLPAWPSPAAPGAGVLPLARRVPFDNRFTVRDRIALAGWSQTAAAFGITRLRLEEAEPGDDEQVGSFALIYRDGDEWARWGLARLCDGSYMVWLMASGIELGTTRSLDAALRLLMPAQRPE